MRRFIFWFIVVFLSCRITAAAEIPMGQSVGSRFREYTEEKDKEKTMERLAVEQVRPPALDETAIEQLPGGASSVYIRKIVVQQAPSLEDPVKRSGLDKAIKEFEYKTLSLQDMTGIAGTLTERLKGAAMKAYVPKQDFADRTLYINCVPDPDR